MSDFITPEQLVSNRELKVVETVDTLLRAVEQDLLDKCFSDPEEQSSCLFFEQDIPQDVRIIVFEKIKEAGWLAVLSSGTMGEPNGMIEIQMPEVKTLDHAVGSSTVKPL